MALYETLHPAEITFWKKYFQQTREKQYLISLAISIFLKKTVDQS